MKIDLIQGTIDNPRPSLIELQQPPLIIGKLPNHTILMWDLDAPGCQIGTKWLHMIYNDDQIYYRSPCPPDNQHRYIVAQFPDHLINFHWYWGCVEIPNNHVGKSITFQVDRVTNKGDCGSLFVKGNRSKGWKRVSPKSKSEHQQLYQKCRNKCYLIPPDKFPICAKCQLQKCNCQIDCRGLNSAKIRAHQWKYDQLYQKIDQLTQQYC